MISSTLGGEFADLSCTAQVARFVNASLWGDLPPAVQREAARAFVNWVGCALGGSAHPSVERALPALQRLSSGERCTVLGRPGTKLDPMNAALLNGLSASAYAFDDTHLASIAHPTAPTVAALLAYAEMYPVRGQDFLHALILSNEVQCRLSSALAVSPGSCHLGLYMTGLTGAAGVAAGVGKLMGLTEQQLAWAIGIGAIQGSGLRSTHGTMCGGFVPADAGRNGLLAAQLAQSNFTCSEDALGAKNGFLDVFGYPANLEAVVNRLGEHYECMSVVAKPYPAGVLIHPSIEACLNLTDEHAFATSDIDRIELRVHKLGLGLTGNREPQDAYEAQVSIYHWVAAVLHQRRAGVFEASNACVQDPAVRALCTRVVVTIAEDLQPHEAGIMITLRDGRTLESSVSPCLGSAQRSMSDEQIDAKFIAQATEVLGMDSARRLSHQCWNLSTAQDVSRAAPGIWG